MELTMKNDSLYTGHPVRASLSKGLAWGFASGLAGTLTMDILLMAALPVAGFPALTCFMIVGDTVARLFSLNGIEMTGGVPLGVITHYLIGPAVGVLFGAAVTKVKALRLTTTKKSVFLAILYVQILSQPILATAPILLKMTASKTIQWYGGALLMHSVLGLVLGVIMSYGLRPAAASLHRWFWALLPESGK